MLKVQLPVVDFMCVCVLVVCMWGLGGVCSFCGI